MLAWPVAVLGRAAGPRAAAAPPYVLTALGPVKDPYSPTAINNKGQMVGSDQAGNAFYYDSGQFYFPAPPKGLSCLTITGLNNKGDFAGYALTATKPGCSSPEYPLWGHFSGSSSYTEYLYNTGGGLGGCMAVSIADDGRISGTCDEKGSEIEVTWTIGGDGYGPAKADLWPKGTAPPSSASAPVRGVDKHGDVIGAAGIGADPKTIVGMFWNPSRRGFTLPGFGVHWKPRSGVTNTFGQSVVSHVHGKGSSSNGTAIVVGFCFVSGTSIISKDEPCRWRAQFKKGKVLISRPLKLDRFKGRDDGGAIDINSHNWIVGNEGDGHNTASLWIPANGSFKIYSLNGIISRYTRWVIPGRCAGPTFGPAMITNSGAIVGTGLFDGQQRGFMLTPKVPASVLPAALAQWAAAHKTTLSTRPEARPCAQK
jgi:hypothetical protein